MAYYITVSNERFKKAESIVQRANENIKDTSHVQ